jgi:hypothetical protein
METPKWPNLRELTQCLAADSAREDSPKIKNWLHELSEQEIILLIEALDPYYEGDKDFRDTPNISGVLSYTDPENHSKVTVGSEKAATWLNNLSDEELETVLEQLDIYHNPGILRAKAALYCSLNEYIFSEKGIISSPKESLQLLKQRRTEWFDRLGRIENDITQDEELVIMGDRSENLSGRTSVLQGNFTRFELPKNDYSAAPRLVIDNGRSVSVLSIIRGVFDKKSGQAYAHTEGMYFFEDAVCASLEAKCEQINNVRNKKRSIMKLFNTCIDILYETPHSYVLENDSTADIFGEHTEMIKQELKTQLKEIFAKQASGQSERSEEATAVIAKYIFALDIIQYYREEGETTLPLYEAA